MEQRFQTIARRLLAEIESDAFGKDRPLPTRAELARRYGVARATMDRAVACLVRKGVLAARRGAGTVRAAMGGTVHTVALLNGSDSLLRRIDPPPELRVEPIAYDALVTKLSRRALRRFDGLLWGYPEDRELAWARETPADLPQLLVNRHLDEFNYVSTDHRGAIRGVTAARLSACPKGMPVFLSAIGPESVVLGMRREGFVDACRNARRFYEVLPLTEDFNGKIAALERTFPRPLKKPLILVSGAIANTGAVISWAQTRGLVWKKDIFYSDFDDSYPLNVWGLGVTSFLQDYETLFATALGKLLDLITGAASEVRMLMPPKYVEGDT